MSFRSTLLLLPLLLPLLVACGDKSDDTGDEPATDDTGEVDEAFDAAATLERYLIGAYDSAEQAAESKDYYEILLTMCPVEFEELGERVLYVEQTLADTPTEPYRQRFYVITEGADDSQAVSWIYEANRPLALVGTCDAPEELDIEIGGVEELEGCEVVLDWDGETWIGGTVEDNCATDWQGAAYATSEITLDEELLVSWDRGWSADDEYMWGATKGGYEFVRKSEMGTWE